MTPSPALLKGLRDLASQQERETTDALTRRVRTLESKMRKLEQQRDQWRARCGELREHVTRYQAQLVEERQRTRTGLPPSEPMLLETVWRAQP